MAINQRYATLYLALNGSRKVDVVSFIAIMRPYLLDNFESFQFPVLQEVTVPGVPDDRTVDGTEVSDNSPFRGWTLFNGNRLVLIKWNLKYKAETLIPPNILTEFRSTYRTHVKRLFSESGMDPIQMSFEYYGAPLTGDKGIPATPSLNLVAAPTTQTTNVVYIHPKPGITTKPSIPQKPVTKKSNNAWLWVLGTIGTIYILKRSW